MSWLVARLLNVEKKQVEQSGLRTPVRESVRNPLVIARHSRHSRSRTREEKVHSNKGVGFTMSSALSAFAC